MTIGRRFELLTAHAAHEIPRHRRQELLEEAQNWIASEECTARDVEELFYLLAAAATIHMSAYCQEIQTQIGGELLEREMKR